LFTARRRAGTRLGALFVVGASTIGLASAAELGEVLKRFDEVQNAVSTLSAEFTETTTNQLLIDPISAEGRFFMTKPDSIRWEYSFPEEMRFVIFQDQYTGYFPKQKRAEKRNIQRWSEHIFRFFGLGQGSQELMKFYEITLDPTHDPASGTFLLILEPTKRRVRKRIPEVRFWLDAETYLPRKVEYRSKSGNARTIEFQEIRLNPDLAASMYHVDIPADVEVSSGFSGLPSWQPDSTQ
jgi:outer membrane lipoprotein carrier protein